MKYSLIIFDLDGTVLDTLDDLAGAVNCALEANGYPTHETEQIRRMIGNGVANLVRRALPESASDETAARVLADFKRRYGAHMNDETRPYPGIRELLGALRRAGVRVGINSNKFDAALQALCRLHFDGLFDYALGESEATPKKPDPTAARRMMALAGATKAQTLYVGDSDVDLDTAANAGIDCAWVAWGFRRASEMRRTDAALRFDDVAALRDFLLS